MLSYATFGVFRSLRNHPLEGGKKAALFAEYNFRSVPFELVGLHYFSRNKYELILHAAVGRTWITRCGLNALREVYTPFYQDELIGEIGLSLRLKYHFAALRLDISRNINDENFFFGFSLNLIALSF